MLEAQSSLDETAVLLHEDEIEPSEPEPLPIPLRRRAESPQELARRLAAEAKARLRPSESPQELARRLAAEAKQKLAPDASEFDDQAETRIHARPPSIEDPVVRVVTGVFPGASVEDVAPVRDREAFCAVWRSHRIRAVQSGDLALAGTASALLYAAGRGATLFAARVTAAGAAWAAWVDAEHAALIGLARPADAYLHD